MTSECMEIYKIFQDERQEEFYKLSACKLAKNPAFPNIKLINIAGNVAFDGKLLKLYRLRITDNFNNIKFDVEPEVRLNNTNKKYHPVYIINKDGIDHKVKRISELANLIDWLNPTVTVVFQQGIYHEPYMSHSMCIKLYNRWFIQNKIAYIFKSFDEYDKSSEYSGSSEDSYGCSIYRYRKRDYDYVKCSDVPSNWYISKNSGMAYPPSYYDSR